VAAEDAAASNSSASAISSLAHKEYVRSGDRAQLAGLQQAVTTMLQQQGIDLTNLRLTPQGFHR
jgi:hypothetical protein